MKAITDWLPRGRRGYPNAAMASTTLVIAGAVLVMAGAGLAGCASSGSSTAVSPAAAGPAKAALAASAPSPSGSAGPAATPGGVFDRVLNDPDVAATPAGFYLTWQASGKDNGPASVLVRADQATGRIEAMRRFGSGDISTPFAVGTSLWAVLATSSGETLLRMNPVTLSVTGQLPVGGGSFQSAGNRDNHLSIAGGALWVADGDRLVRVSLRTMKAIRVVTLPGAFTSAIAGNADGSVLIVSEANSGGLGSLQRRDPVTGALLASHQVIGVTAPALGGVIDSGAWLAEPTGMMGYVDRVSTATLAAVPGTSVTGSNGIDVALAGGVIWVSQQDGGPGDNYCANPVTGRVLARIPFPSRELDSPIAFTSQYVYYGASASDGDYLKRLAVPAACRA